LDTGLGAGGDTEILAGYAYNVRVLDLVIETARRCLIRHLNISADCGTYVSILRRHASLMHPHNQAAS
jgi:hypothetical protein